ncbi:MAG: glycosyltransferase family 2 protein [Actinomycetia bacterium]|nr:glycosyltransferase family 2 protein [Actinomycetes bacterium]
MASTSAPGWKVCDLHDDRPRVTIGIPTFNGEPAIGQAVESALAQDYDSFEVLVVDNCSTDRTPEILAEIAARDPRLRVVRNRENIGQNHNFTRVFELAQGEFFRWLGTDDVLEPSYVGKCVAAFDNNPEVVMVTTYQRHVSDDGIIEYAEYQGQRVVAAEAIDRLGQLLPLLSSGDYRLIDPVYSMMRSSTLHDTSLVLPLQFGDALLSAEMSLLGPWAHVPEPLSNRTLTPFPKGSQAYRRYATRPEEKESLVAWLYARIQRLVLCKAMLGLVWRGPHGIRGKVRGSSHIARFYLVTNFTRVRNALIRRLPLGSRPRLPGLDDADTFSGSAGQLEARRVTAPITSRT